MKAIFLFFLGVFLVWSSCMAQRWEDIDTTGYYKKEVVKRAGYTLLFINKDSTLNPDTRQRMIDVFFATYPAEAKRFNPDAPRTVTFEVSSRYKGVAATAGALARFDRDYLRKHPEDVDIVTHEMMHVVQSYDSDSGVPGWITEGLADYARYTFGVDNKGAGWTLPEYKSSQSYTDAYRVTARFLVWLSIHFRADIADQLNTAARTKMYSLGWWNTFTGKSLDELWYLYISDPVLPAVIPRDPALRRGKLANGFTYLHPAQRRTGEAGTAVPGQ